MYMKERPATPILNRSPDKVQLYMSGTSSKQQLKLRAIWSRSKINELKQVLPLVPRMLTFPDKLYDRIECEKRRLKVLRDQTGASFKTGASSTLSQYKWSKLESSLKRVDFALRPENKMTARF